MAIHFYCPLGHRLVVPDERAGKKGRCPVCQQKVYVPEANPRPSGKPKRPAVPRPAAHGARPLSTNTPVRSPAPPPPTATYEATYDDPFIRVDVDAMLHSKSPVLSAGEVWRDPIARRSEIELRQMAYCLAAGMLALVALALVPVFGRPPWSEVPVWVRIVWPLTVALAIYAVVLLAAPGPRVLTAGVWLCAALAGVYAMGAALVLATPAAKVPLFGLAEVRASAGGWCMAQVMLLALSAYLCGALGGRWTQLPRTTAGSQAGGRR